MSKADIKYKELVLDIINNGYNNKNESTRTVYADGCPAYTKSIFGVQIKFKEGEIPLLTSKYVATNTAIKELLLFWQRQTNKKENFHDWNVHIWDEWFNDNGDLGTSYSYQFESRPRYKKIEVQRRTKKHHKELSDIKVGDAEDHQPKREGSIIGDIIESQNSGKFLVLDEFRTNKSIVCYVQFLSTGFKQTITKGNATKGKVKDPYARRQFNVGFYGEPELVANYLTKEEKQKLYYTWRGMLQRCYTSTSLTSKNYNHKGIFIDERWHNFSTFLSDMQDIPQFFIAKEDKFKGWNLDKDYFGSNCYSRDTCVWLDVNDNARYANGRTIKAVDKYGKEYKFLSISEASEALDIGASSVHRVLKGVYESTKGYTFSYGESNNELLERNKLSNNQVVDVLRGLKLNPTSRRHMTSFWDDSTVDEKALQECAFQTQWNVRGDKLDLILTQRSADVGLGLPFNWWQYWVLQNMIAQTCGFKVGEFTHHIGNCHIYDRHESILLEQIKNDGYHQPDFWINHEVTDFFNFTIKDFEIIDYKHGGKAPMEVAL
ncbi:thymidylate synthase [Aquibacillus saliphilus]|uniref:thymidylate synthase n=1 Tax=Aquibacillus saliphilus TaxID=1909422 RepID=UPI001CF0C6C5|nr:thymidylate synthase [Aquibacillus saliphilus]